ncbi:MAG: zf-TFIIB domain-containing protein [Ignavibacteria bacterium]|nr:zf-TFIIB domain-containing protein [Ignavibacteria bacterium]MBT8382455.1 zf-TFIIB domain-containing protein [Ignavibacteria bacterium]MBT8392832.1 zf-TFIIB domain-containing protein [Ignavibacteria bacterium]NNJ52131.1 zf-TFIIB domain-containing protein [Ignavibacteriaceae bacterium]NNL20217.1 zf-TFIIB domain-containing protein [Ignavibacteriaceae bacterium]
MIILELDQVEIDYCTTCEGIWLDSGELEMLLENEAERKKVLDTLHEDHDHPEKLNKCPICGKKMIKVHAGENKEVLIDKCKKDHGLWFDKGELNTVVELGAKEEENKIAHLLKEMFENKISTNDKGETK